MAKNKPETLTAGTLIDGARMYAASADAVNDKYPNALHVLTHLLGMSLELSLKALLRHEGYSEKKLRKIGHDLGKLLEHAEKLGIEETGSRNFILRVVGENYSSRLYAYPEEGIINTISPWRLREMTHEILSICFGIIKGEKMGEEMKNEPGLSIMSDYPNEINASAWATKKDYA